MIFKHAPTTKDPLDTTITGTDYGSKRGQILDAESKVLIN